MFTYDPFLGPLSTQILRLLKTSGRTNGRTEDEVRTSGFVGKKVADSTLSENTRIVVSENIVLKTRLHLQGKVAPKELLHRRASKF